ncbi:hypothetical protein TNCV_523471 [Trichonephila clavipes]|nr:hypothetical protein TNCV_523471 [Trichonephila clavipes]
MPRKTRRVKGLMNVAYNSQGVVWKLEETPSSLDRGSKLRDHFAKVATTNGVEVSVPAPRSYVIKTLQNKLIENWESWWSNSNTGLRI